MYSLNIVWYIFLAGMGSGAYAVASVVGFIGQITGRRSVQEYGRLAEGGFWLGPLLVSISAIFLLFDLGSPEKAFIVISQLHVSVLSIGIWSVLIFVSVATLLALLKLHPQINKARRLKVVLQLIALLAALSTMSYTGVFFASMQTVPFHNHWLLVVLLVSSSLATGAAVITLFGFLNQHRKAMLYSLRLIPGIDVGLIIAECLSLTAFLVVMAFKDEYSIRCLMMLINGEFAPLFWLGTVVCGLIIPSFIAITEHFDPRPIPLALSALLIFVGGFTLRYCLIETGLHFMQLKMLM